MAKTMYVARLGGGLEIHEVEVTHETAKKVTIGEHIRNLTNPSNRCFFLVPSQQVHKNAEGHSFHETWDEAHAELVEHAKSQVNSAHMAVMDAQGRLGNVKRMKRPTERGKAAHAVGQMSNNDRWREK